MLKLGDQSITNNNSIISSWDGTLSPNDFSLAARAFADKWQRFNSSSPPWLWLHPPKQQPLRVSQHVEGYLALENICILGSAQDNHDEVGCAREEETSVFEEEEAIDNATLVHGSHHVVHYYDFHIVYSASYRVPVLYFRAYSDDGQPLLLNEIEKDLPSCSSKMLLESKWTFITQEEHPFLNRPWYKLHPCATSEWMKLLFRSDAVVAANVPAIELYLVSWFSVVGQVVGLRIPLEMVNSHSNCVTDRYTSDKE